MRTFSGEPTLQFHAYQTSSGLYPSICPCSWPIDDVNVPRSRYDVTNPEIRRRSIFFCYMPSIDRDNLPSQRMSMYPAHVLDRLPDCAKTLTLSGYI